MSWWLAAFEPELTSSDTAPRSWSLPLDHAGFGVAYVGLQGPY
jgi:hypothetical protein